ncbi:hypothetical protein [Prosthecobacter sp.]|uniref:hypothetical protein n=1 Tax=Prosthecobacter sp. TaxID=1965333 RepID=UPI0037835BDC
MTTISNPEIDLIQSRMRVTIPGLYRKLLVELGYGRIDEDHEIYHPEQIREAWESFFDEPSDLFTIYFPFGFSPRLQEMWIIRPQDERVASIWHETVPDDWDEEKWLTYEDWIAKYFDEKPNT